MNADLSSKMACEDMRVVILANGGPGSFEEQRARILRGPLPERSCRILVREPGTLATWRRWRSELEREAPTAIYSINTALPSIPFGLFWARRRGIPFVLDTGDVVFEMARRSGVERIWRWPLLWAGERCAWKGSSVVVVRSTCFQEYLRGLGYPRVEVIRDSFHPGPSPGADAVAALRRSLGLEGFFVLGVMGSLVWSPRLKICYGWDLVEAMALLRDLPVRGLIIGDGNGRERLERKAEALGVLDRIHFTGRIPYDQLPLYLRVMDVGLSTQTNNLPGQVRTTGKVPEYMAAGVFVLASRVGEAARLLPDEMLLDYAGEVDASYPGRIAAKLRLLHGNPARLALRDGLPGRVAAVCSAAQIQRDFAFLCNQLQAGA